MTDSAHIDIWFEISGEVPQLRVPVPRVPIVGERIVGPDDMGTHVVKSVSYVYADGFHFEPTRVIVIVRKGEE